MVNKVVIVTYILLLVIGLDDKKLKAQDIIEKDMAELKNLAGIGSP